MGIAAAVAGGIADEGAVGTAGEGGGMAAAVILRIGVVDEGEAGVGTVMIRWETKAEDTTEQDSHPMTAGGGVVAAGAAVGGGQRCRHQVRTL